MIEIPMIYLASPYTAIGLRGLLKKRCEASRLSKITQIASKLTEIHEFAFILPITQSAAMTHFNPTMGTKFTYWSNIDYTFIRKSDEMWVVMLEGWEQSVGVTKEIKYANKLGKPIKYIDADLFTEDDKGLATVQK